MCKGTNQYCAPCSVREAFDYREVQADWQDAVIVFLYKGKRSKSNCTTNRLISMLSVHGKVFAHVILARLYNSFNNGVHSWLYSSQLVAQQLMPFLLCDDCQNCTENFQSLCM